MPVENNKLLVRDAYSKAVINRDVDGLSKARQEKNKALARLSAEQAKEEKINTLEREVCEMKILLSQILERLS